MMSNNSSTSKRIGDMQISHSQEIKRRRTQSKNDDSICKQCRQINLQAVLQPSETARIGIKSHNGILIANLGTRCYDNPTNNCVICKLFYELRVPVIPKQDYELRAYSFLEYSTLINYPSCPEDLKRKYQPYLAVVPCVYAGDHVRQHTKENGFLLCYEIGADNLSSLLTPQELQCNVDFHAIKEWLEYCKLHHKRLCWNKQGEAKNLKLIDCTSLSIVAAPSSCSYAALSYVWGKQPGKVSPIETEKHGINGKVSFSRTIMDAIYVCRELSITHVWVDQYCINQNDIVEKLEQIGQMDIIYQLADLTIIAAAGDGAHFGLPGVSRTSRRTPPAATINNIRIVSSAPHPHHVIPKTTWASRGWTMQEATLSRRRLVFTENQVYFECRAMNCQETLKIDMDTIHSKRRDKTLKFIHSGLFGGSGQNCYAPVDDQNTDRWSNMTRYLELVQEYSTRNLTVDSDALNAFEGIMKHFAKLKLAILHFWGIPFINPRSSEHEYHSYDSLTIGLLWAHKWQFWSSNSPIRRSNFPSWSWAGWKGAVRFSIANRDGHKTLDVQVKDISLEYETDQVIKFEDFLKVEPHLKSTFLYPKVLHLYLPVVLPGSITGAYNVEANQFLKLGGSLNGTLHLSHCPRNDISVEQMFVLQILELLLIAGDARKIYLVVIETNHESSTSCRMGTMTADRPKNWRTFKQEHTQDKRVRLV